MSKVKDTDFLFISSRLRATENMLLTRERMERMLDARSDEDAVKVLAECGYQGLEPLSSEGLEQALAAAREETFSELAELSPLPELVDVFRMKYDYHNAKALVKCQATGQDATRMLIDAGRVPALAFQEAMRRDDLSDLPEALRTAVIEASDRLSATGDPQRCDFLLDRAYYTELSQAAEASKCSFLVEYVRLLIDGANLKSAVRCLRMHKDLEFVNAVIVEGGSVDKSTVTAAILAGTGLETVFTGPLEAAAALGDEVSKGGRQTAFEKAVDDAINDYLKTSRMIPFGAGVLVSYIAAKENEITAARIILSGRLSGVPAESIRERLREAYV